MLTPNFQLKQDEGTLTIVIMAPHARVTDTEIFIEKDEFRFHSKPYFLRLSLPGNILENGHEKANYESEKGVFTIVVPKETPGEVFEGLDMLTSLLTPKSQKHKKPVIEVIGSGDETEISQTHEEEEEEEFNWYVEQKPYEENDLSLDGPKYGFANQKSGVFKRLQDEVYEIVDLSDPENCPPADRRTMRELAETEKFDPDHYIADLYDDDNIQHIMKYDPPWCFVIGEKDTSPKIDFTDEEKQKMKNLPKKEYLLDDAVVTTLYLGLIDILFGYAYNDRVNEGEENVESGWTICKLSATLSWLETFTSVEEVVLSCTRRSLCYPLYRHWALSRKVLQDVHNILTSGKQQVLRCLLDIHTIMGSCYPRYILNDLYITDYCVWIQTTSDKRLKALASTLNQVKIQKDDIGFDLNTLETSAADTIRPTDRTDSTDHTDPEEELIQSLKAVSIKQVENDSDDNSDDSSDDSDESNDSDEFEDKSESEGNIIDRSSSNS